MPCIVSMGTILTWLPAIEKMLPMLKWGISVNHSGLLPILKV